jgi:carbonic anhydrase/acetyltransferase-like protein (isoleucine patch superfamily)
MGPRFALWLAAIVDVVSQGLYRRLTRRILRASGVTVRGLPLWVSPSVYWDLLGGITVGDRCVISSGVRLLTHDFSMDRVAERRLGIGPQELVRQAPIEIGDQAFIGMNSMILPGVTIGPGAIVGAGSVVTRDVPADTVVAGNPAAVVCDTETHWTRNHSKFEWAPRRR